MRRQHLVALALAIGLVALAALLLASIFDVTLVPQQPAHTSAPLLAANALEVGQPSESPTTISLGLGIGLGDVPSNSMADPVRAAHVEVLRFGDVHADDYDWQQGCLYDPTRPHPDCYSRAGHGSPLDQFLAFAGQVGAQPLIVVNGEIDDPQQAAQLVTFYWQHCTHAPGRTCPDPYWEIGDSPATWNHFAIPLNQRQPSESSTANPDQYAAVVTSYRAAMNRAAPYYADHGIKIVADEFITGATDESWIDALGYGGIDTHFAPLIYSRGSKTPSVQDVVQAVSQRNQDRPGIDLWLQGLREGLQQFDQSSSLKIFIGRWSIDANTGLNEPSVYGGYAQALFTAALLASVWQDAGGANPIAMAIQAPMSGPAQEPFDITNAGAPRSAVAVYTLLGRYFGAHPVSVELGSAAAKAGLLAAGASLGPGDTRLLLVNLDQKNAHTVDLQGTARAAEMWWIVQDNAQVDGASTVHHAVIGGSRVTVPAWGIAVVRVRA
jgi:hypothetical protein